MIRKMLVFSVLVFSCCWGGNSVETAGRLELVPAEYPLGQGALVVKSKKPLDYTAWTTEDLRGSYQLQQLVATYWRNGDIADDYFIHGYADDSDFSWQMVPYPNDPWTVEKYGRIVNVLTRVVVGTSQLSEDEIKGLADSYQGRLSIKYPERIKDFSKDDRFDAFCDADIVKRQQIYEGEQIRVLYDYSPNRSAAKGLHFLIIPKTCKREFAALTESEYIELQKTAQAMIHYFREHGYSAMDIFSNNGPNSGQSVPHFHQHLIVFEGRPDGFWEHLSLLVKYLIPSTPLPKNELTVRVDKHRLGVGEYLKKAALQKQ